MEIKMANVIGNGIYACGIEADSFEEALEMAKALYKNRAIVAPMPTEVDDENEDEYWTEDETEELYERLDELEARLTELHEDAMLATEDMDWQTLSSILSEIKDVENDIYDINCNL